MSDYVPKQNTERIYKSISEGTESTKKGSVYNLSFVSRFCKEKKIDIQKVDELNEDTVCDLDFLDELASFLTETTHINSDEPLKSGSALQIFGDVKKFLKRNSRKMQFGVILIGTRNFDIVFERR